MKIFLIQLLSITFVLLITGSIQSVTADHSEPDQGIFKNEQTLQELEATKDSNYQIHLQTVLRNGDGQLISVIEGTHGFVIPHQISDHVFDTLMGKKEIVIIDNIKYEKVQFSTSSEQPWLFDSNDRTLIFNSAIELCGEPIKKYGYECANIFWARNGMINIEVGDVITQQWTILRDLN